MVYNFILQNARGCLGNPHNQEDYGPVQKPCLIGFFRYMSQEEAMSWEAQERAAGRLNGNMYRAIKRQKANR